MPGIPNLMSHTSFSAMSGRGLGNSAGTTIATSPLLATPTQQTGGISYFHTVMALDAAALGFLVFLRFSLPKQQRSIFDLVIMMVFPLAILYSALGIWARKNLRHGNQSGIDHGFNQILKLMTPN